MVLLFSLCPKGNATESKQKEGNCDSQIAIIHCCLIIIISISGERYANLEKDAANCEVQLELTGSNKRLQIH